MDIRLDSTLLRSPAFISPSRRTKSPIFVLKRPETLSPFLPNCSVRLPNLHRSCRFPGFSIGCSENGTVLSSRLRVKSELDVVGGGDEGSLGAEEERGLVGFSRVLLVNRGLVLGVLVCGFFVLRCNKALAVEGVVDVGNQILKQGLVGLRNAWPKMSQVLTVFREQGLILAALLGLSAFFSMAETSITTLWPWKVRELAEKEPENGVFRVLRKDVTRFLTTILIGTTY